MIEVTIYNYLKDEMDVPVFLEQPDNAPESYIVLVKTSSNYENKLSSSTFAFQSYAPSLYGAAKLNDDLKKTMYNIVVLDEIAFVRLNSDYNFTDTTTKRYRYQAVFDFKHY